MVNYYATALLWARLIDLRAKRGQTLLTQVENDSRQYFVETDFHLPQPLATYIHCIGHVEDDRGRELYIADHTLAVANAGVKGGYYSAAVDDQHVNLFGEIPCLGIAADVLQAEASAEVHPVPNIPVLPPNTTATETLPCFIQIEIRKEEVRQVLNSHGITNLAFKETIATTRFNVNIVQYISDIFGQIETFRCEKINIVALTQEGSRAQLVETRPSLMENVVGTFRTQAVVQPGSVSADEVSIVGASYMLGFQLYKEAFVGDHSLWLPVHFNNPNDLPEVWIADKNLRRVLPGNLANMQYNALFDSQEFQTRQIVRCMLKSKR